MTTDPFETLGLDPSATPGEVKARWKVLAKTHHPDTSPLGDLAEFQRYHEAYKAALKKADNAPCGVCNGNGNGTVARVRGFVSLDLVCPGCKGSGKRS